MGRASSYRIDAFAGLLMLTPLVINGCGADAPPGTGAGGGALIGPASIGAGGAAQSVALHGDAMTADEAYHLLRRAAFGASPEEVKEAVGRGLYATVDDLLKKKPVPAAVTALAESYEHDIPRRWLVHMIEGPNPLHERLALFWHDRFAASARVLGGGHKNLAVVHMEMLRRNALGNYRTFLQELTIDPLMLVWLDGAISPKDNPNENYAREFWELFTLGRDVLYTERDIREAARAFTGIGLLKESGEDPRPIFDLLHHDETLKAIFPGRAPAANHDYLSVIDLTLEQPEAAQYVARNLFVFFVHDHPSNAVVKELASVLVKSDFEIAPLVRRILTSKAFFSDEARGNQISSPVEHIVGMARTFDMHFDSEESQGYAFTKLARELKGAGQELLNPPGVEGWAENEAWLEDQWILSRARALGQAMEFGPDRTDGLPFHLLPPVEEWGDRGIRDRLVDAIAAVLHLELTDAEREIYVEVLDQNGWRALHLEEPDRQARHVFEMMRLMTMDERVISR